MRKLHNTRRFYIRRSFFDKRTKNLIARVYKAMQSEPDHLKWSIWTTTQFNQIHSKQLKYVVCLHHYLGRIHPVKGKGYMLWIRHDLSSKTSFDRPKTSSTPIENSKLPCKLELSWITLKLIQLYHHLLKPWTQWYYLDYQVTWVHYQCCRSVWWRHTKEV